MLPSVSSCPTLRSEPYRRNTKRQITIYSTHPFRPGSFPSFIKQEQMKKTTEHKARERTSRQYWTHPFCLKAFQRAVVLLTGSSNGGVGGCRMGNVQCVNAIWAYEKHVKAVNCFCSRDGLWLSGLSFGTALGSRMAG